MINAEEYLNLVYVTNDGYPDSVHDSVENVIDMIEKVQHDTIEDALDIIEILKERLFINNIEESEKEYINKALVFLNKFKQ